MDKLRAGPPKLRDVIFEDRKGVRLVEVSRLKSFAAAAAAAELELATPSVWQQVRGLEAEFGVELVGIDGKNVELTEDGQVLRTLKKGSGLFSAWFNSVAHQVAEPRPSGSGISAIS